MITYSNEGLTVNGTFISWVDVDKGRNAIRFSDKVLVTIKINYDRRTFFNSFIYSRNEWREVKERLSAAKKPLFMGELAGKHSEVHFRIGDERCSVTEVTDIDDISAFYTQYGTESGNFSFLLQYHTAVDDGEI